MNINIDYPVANKFQSKSKFSYNDETEKLAFLDDQIMPKAVTVTATGWVKWNPTMTFAEAVKAAVGHQNAYVPFQTALEIANAAISRMIADNTARTYGKRMESKYNGTDSATGERFTAGTEIFYSSFSGDTLTVVA